MQISYIRRHRSIRIMDIGNDVDLSNNNITPLWKRRTDNCKSAQESRKPKPRPVSYHINGVMMTDFPLEDNGCSPTLSQTPERVAVTPQCPDRNTVVLKHVLHKPSRKSRVVRSISIGHLSNGRFSLPKFRSEDNKSASLDNRVYNRDRDIRKTSNGETLCPEKYLQDVSSPLILSSQQDSVIFGTVAPSESDLLRCSSPALSPCSPDNNNFDHNDLSSLSSTTSPSPPACHTSTPSHSSTSSTLSLSSLTSSDPPTPRSTSPAERGQAPFRQSSSSPSSSQDTRHASPCPSLSPSPSPAVVLSTHSPAALKMGTQQIIPKGLASDIRQSKAASPGLLGLGDHSKRALKALSMVETGAYFSTGGHSEGREGESESPGTLRRGLRSTSYRRAVVSGVDVPVPLLDLRAHRPSAARGPLGDIPDSPVSPASSGTLSPTSPGTSKTVSPGSAKQASPKISKLANLRTDKSTSNGKNKVRKPVGTVTNPNKPIQGINL